MERQHRDPLVLAPDPARSRGSVPQSARRPPDGRCSRGARRRWRPVFPIDVPTATIARRSAAASATGRPWAMSLIPPCTISASAPSAHSLEAQRRSRRCARRRRRSCGTSSAGSAALAQYSNWLRSSRADPIALADLRIRVPERRSGGDRVAQRRDQDASSSAGASVPALRSASQPQPVADRDGEKPRAGARRRIIAEVNLVFVREGEVGSAGFEQAARARRDDLRGRR